MKTTKWLVVAVVALVAAGGLMVAVAHAQETRSGHFGRGRFLERARAKLNLSDAQVSQIKAVLSADKDKLTTLLSAWHDARIELRTEIQKPGASEADIRAASAKVASVEADLAVERSKLYGKISPILTPDQLAKVNEFQERMDDFVDGAIMVLGKRLSE